VASSIWITTNVMLSILLTTVSRGPRRHSSPAIEGIFLPLSILQAAKARIS
jgi:hypothetical protein